MSVAGKVVLSDISGRLNHKNDWLAQVWSLSNYMANVWTYMRYPGDLASPHASPRQALSPQRLPSPRVRPLSRDGRPESASAARSVSQPLEYVTKTLT